MNGKKKRYLIMFRLLYQIASVSLSVKTASDQALVTYEVTTQFLSKTVSRCYVLLPLNRKF
jgi:hypothetical protein